MIAAYLAGKLIFRLRDVLLLIAVSGFVAVLLNPLVVCLQRWRVPRRGCAVAVVTLWAVLVFTGLAVAFGYPLANAVTHHATRCRLTSTRQNAARARSATWRASTTWPRGCRTTRPSCSSIGRGLGRPALTLGKGALSLLLSLTTIFVLVVLLLLEDQCASGILAATCRQAAPSAFPVWRTRSIGRSPDTCSVTA